MPGPSDFQLWVSMSLSPLFPFLPELFFEMLSFSFLTRTEPQAVHWICFDSVVFPLRLVFTLSLLFGYLAPPLPSWGVCISRFHGQMKAYRTGNETFALCSFQESQVASKNVSGLVELEQILLWDGLDSKMWSGPALSCTFLPPRLHSTAHLCTHIHARSHKPRLRNASINAGNSWLR